LRLPFTPGRNFNLYAAVSFVALSRVEMFPRCVFLIGIFVRLILASYIDIQDSVLCDILAATNIQDLKGTVTEWNCTTNNVPSVNPCSFNELWSFLDCSSDNITVVGLNFTNSRLIGTLPTSIGDLSALAALTVVNNSMIGSLPAELGKLGLLTSLVITDTSISGRIPTQIGDISGLQYLVLDSNTLQGSVPSALCVLSNIASFSVNYNSGITCFDSCITVLSGSVSMAQTDYSLMSCSSVGHWQALCDIISAADWGSDAQDANPEAWRCHDGVPYSNPCNSWTYLSNGLQLVPISCDSSGDPFVVTSLHLVGGGAGPLPSSISALTGLSKLKISHSSFSGTVPAEIGSLIKLTSLFVSGTDFSGQIPDSVGSLTKLSTLTLSFNSLTGTLPSSLGLLGQLLSMSVTANFLTGTVPSTLCEISGITSLDVTSNAGLTCYSECLTVVEVFPRDYIISPADEAPRQFESCNPHAESEEAKLFGIGYATVFLIGGVALACAMCFRSVFLKSEEEMFAAQRAEMDREDCITCCCHCLFHNPCCDCRHTHHRPTRKRGYRSVADESASSVAAGRAEVVIRSAGSQTRVLANERSKIIPISKSMSEDSQGGFNDSSINSPIRVASSRFDL
jgi:Leucine-rich repeat (LRR) protein